MLELKTLLLKSRSGCLNNEKGLKRGGYFCLWINPCHGWDRVSGSSQDVSNNGHIPDRWPLGLAIWGTGCMHAGRPQFHRTQAARPDSRGTISRTSVSHSAPVSCLKAMDGIQLLRSGPPAGRQSRALPRRGWRTADVKGDHRAPGFLVCTLHPAMKAP